jgi:hypothetical protein
MLDVPANKQIKTLYDTKWLEDNEPIKKVSSTLYLTGSFTCGMKSDGRALRH